MYDEGHSPRLLDLPRAGRHTLAAYQSISTPPTSGSSRTRLKVVSLSSVRSATSPMSLRPISFVGSSHFEPASDGSRSLLARPCRERWPPATCIATRRLGTCGLRHEGLVPTGPRVTVNRPLLRKTAYDVRVLQSMRSLTWRRPRCRSQKDRLLYAAILTSPSGTLESRSFLHRPWPRAACENQRNG